MKKVFSHLLLLTLILLIFNACKKSTQPDPVAATNLTFKLDGVAKAFAATAAKSPVGINLAGTSGSEMFFLTIVGPNLGNFDIATNAAIITYEPDASTDYYASSGLVTVTSYSAANGTIAGTFQATCTDATGTMSKVITEGAFNCAVSK